MQMTTNNMNSQHKTLLLTVNCFNEGLRAHLEILLDRNSSNQRLEDHIKLHHLQQIMQEFFQHTQDDLLVPQEPGFFSGKLRRRIPGSMNLEEFKDTIYRVLGTDEYDDYLEKLFIKLDTMSDGFVDWNEFCTHLLLLYRENDYMHTKCDLPFVEEAKIRHIVQNRQEQTSKIVAVHSPVRYVTISKEGAICVWHPNMTMDKHYAISDHVDDQKRRFRMWVTDAIYMRNCDKMAIGSTSRDIRFYDVSSSQYFEEYHLFALADVPYCFDYYYNPQQPNTESILIFGVDTGSIHLLTFLKPVTQLFETPFKNDGGVQKVYMQDIASHNTWVRHHVITAVHPEIIRQVRYLPDNDAIISASASPKSTVVICDIFGVKKSYVFRIEKGVECFDHNKNLNLLATGSGDHIVRLWNPYVTHSPVAILSGHVTGVIGVVLHEQFKQVFSYSKDAVIKVWDTREHTCLQTIFLKFPSSLHGRIPEHGQSPIHLQEPPHSALVVTCNDYIASLRLGRPEEGTAHTETTHDTQLCCAIYNKLLKQVVTGCDSSTIAAWDVETGAKSVVFPNAHEGEEITCLAFDDSYRRLISAARNGTVKVWNFHNGHNLHTLQNVGEAEVTGIVHLADQKVILTVGWNRMILSYDDSDPENKHLPAKTRWKGGQLHKDDILTSDYAAPNFLATASYDGEIIVWEADTERLYLRLRKGQPPNISKKLDALKTRTDRADDRPSTVSSRSRPNSRHRSSHRLEQGQTAPVDKLHFLKTRAAVRFTESAVLISSEAGTLRWWNIYSVNKEMGCFYVPSIADESVLAMCSTPDDSLLITGDTLGTVCCWDICKYCVKFEGSIDTARPPTAAFWKAHDLAVVSVQFIEHTAGDFILTASTDRTARLWTPQGHLVGTFGQKLLWNLTKPSTWVHPKTPWSADESDHTPEQRETKANAIDEENAEETDNVREEETRNEDMQAITDNVTLGLEGRQKSYMSHIPTFLGIKAEQDLARRQRDRKDRRAMFGDISQLNTALFGKQCSPYHALTAPEWQDIEVPKDLPLSQRMQSLGYSGTNLTPDYIKSMDFSYGHTDMPLTRTHTSSVTRGLTPSLTKASASRRSSNSRLDKEDALLPTRANLLLPVNNQP
ncbi:hypothetical protein BsWGS_21047 [Bradybaena similaris]